VARVLCVDAGGRVLLLRWRDPTDGHCLWEPPGGGIEPGETPFQAAGRELAEETGFDPAAVRPQHVTVERDVRWKGVRFVGPEHFFLARFDGAGPAPARDGLLDHERRDLLEYRWVPVAALAGLDDPLHPPGLRAVLDSLDAGQRSPRRRQSGG
jgi:8-oxo-dGTP pyrophosphatase MutT (NUDIX family)